MAARASKTDAVKGAVTVAANGIGMAPFTVIMGNGFAAYPVMTDGIGCSYNGGTFHAVGKR